MLTSLLNTALLGTAKQPFQPAHDTPAVLQQYWQQLAHATPEDRFYQFSALSHAYYYGGQTLAHSHSPDWQALPTPPDNSHEHIVPATLTPLLKTWIQQHNDPLLRYAFQQLAQHRYTLPTDSLFDILSYFQTQANSLLTTYAHTTLFGVYGQWLLQQTGQYHPTPTPNQDNDWELATFSQRKTWLAEKRRVAPDEAREQLQNIWQTAPANHRYEYLCLMADKLSPNDTDFLTVALKDRSKNVKEEAKRLLRQLPNSPMNQQYQAWLAERLRYQPSQQTWSYQAQPYTADMKAAGIEEISPQKGESDDQYQLRQLVYALPLATWADFLQVDEAQAADILTLNPPPIQHLDWETWIQQIDHPYFNIAAIKHLNNTAKGRLSHYLTRLFMYLPADTQETLLNHTSFNPLNFIDNFHFVSPFETTWGESYSHLILDGMKQAKRNFANTTLMQIATCLHPAPSISAALATLPKLSETEPYLAQWYQPLQDYFEQKQKFHALLSTF